MGAVKGQGSIPLSTAKEVIMIKRKEMTEEEIEAFKNLIPTVMYLSERDWNALMEMLESPPEPNEALRRLMREDDE